MSSYDPVEETFNVAKKSFRDSLKDRKLYDDILATTATINDVYQLAAQLQEDAASKSKLRHLKRLQPFLDALAGYGQVVEVFVQVKPDIMALIWGPIRLILKWSSELTSAMDSMAHATVKIAQALPQFSDMVKIFEDRVRVKAALALFFEDILDFYSIVLKVFTNSKWRTFWNMLWEQNKTKVDAVVKNMAEHVLLMRNEVSLAEIAEAHKARAKALAHAEEIIDFQELQKFQGLRTRLNPTLYGNHLDRYRNRIHQGSTKWLLHDKSFQDWLNVSKRDTTWLWIRGIPGAGKTYLAAAAVQEAMKHHRTLYAFASYNDQSSMTALSITQSMIFQAAAGDKDLQTQVVEFSENDLTSDGGKALELLRSLITMKKAYIIVDGFDEMEESERGILLKRLDSLANGSSELKILICSRSEDDIAKALEKKSKMIRVDERNMASIQGFVNYRAQEWMAHQHFDIRTESEVSSLLAPLAARANGMFLYARIVLDNLIHLSSIEEIRRELKALPTDLNEAYQRVFTRINSSHPRMREKCRKILGWIGCAPVSMTSLEMEQALQLDGPTEGVPSIVGSTNFLKLCGPIVEIVDDRPQFVHFTAQEYIFSSQINNFIDKAFAHQTLAIANVAYLCSGTLDLDLAESRQYVKDNILGGRYRLLGYVASNWAGLTLVAVRTKTTFSQQRSEHLDTLKSLITRAASEVNNYDFEPDEDSVRTKIEEGFVDGVSEEARDMLNAARRFALDERQPDWTCSNADIWVNLDPLITSRMLVRVKDCFESLLCKMDIHDGTLVCEKDCQKSILQCHYGDHFYKCSYFSCPYSRQGFKSRSARNDHEQAHGRPWKCPIITCEFSVIGFNQRTRRDIHVKRFHQYELGGATVATKVLQSDFDTLSHDEVQPLLFVLVRDGDEDGVRRLLDSKSASKLRPDVLTAARTLAVKQGSLGMTQMLCPKNEKYLPSNVVIHAIESEDLEFVQWTLTKTDPEDIQTGKFHKAMLNTPSDEIYSHWEKHLVGAEQMHSSNRGRFSHILSLLRVPIINSVKNSPHKEERLAHSWEYVISELRRRDGGLYYQITEQTLDKTLMAVAKSTTSVKLGKALLELGAEPGPTYSHMPSPLAAAAKKTTKEAAEFMKLLLEYGAPTPSEHYRDGTKVYAKIYLDDEPGPKGIQTWLGVTWKELVEMNKDTWKKKYSGGLGFD